METDWACLPEDVLIQILSGVVNHSAGLDDLVYALNQLQSVCKAWQSATRVAFPYPMGSGFDAQFLLEKRRDETKITLFNPLSSSPARNVDIPDHLCGYSVRFSKYGWLLMSGENDAIFFNPFTKSEIMLPKLPYRMATTFFKAVTFTSDPTSKDCVIFGIDSYANYSVDLYMISHGETSWRQILTRRNGKECFLIPSLTNLVHLRGKLYCLCKHGQLITFDPTKSRKWEVKVPEERPHLVYENYLLEFNGELVCVFISLMGESITISTWDESKCNWVDIDDLGEYSIFLSETTSFASKTLKTNMQNKIYLPRFHGKYGVFFCMKDRSYQTFEAQSLFNSKNLGYTDLQLECCWMEPTKPINTTNFQLDWFVSGKEEAQED